MSLSPIVLSVSLSPLGLRVCVSLCPLELRVVCVSMSSRVESGVCLYVF